MDKKPTNRVVKTHLDRNGILIFSLLQGQEKQRTVHRFGYGTRHGIWMRVQELRSGMVALTTESAAIVKEQIAEWSKK